jgi:hypothetical protein
VVPLVLALAGVVSPARGQVVFQAQQGGGQFLLAPAGDQGPVVFQSQQGGGPFLLAPAGDQGPLFLEGAPGGRVGTLPVAPAQVGGTINGNPVVNFGTLPAVFPSNLRVDVGFEYLRPVFPGRSVTLVIPSGVNADFSTLAGSGNVSYDFGFIPKVTVGYQFPDLGFGVTASGELTSLSGHLNRTIDSAAGTANLTASSTIDLGVANLIEASLPIALGRFPRFQDSCLRDTTVLTTLGLRYTHLAENYNASLDSGGNASTLAAHQDWDGFGLTTSLSFIHPLRHNFFLYGVSRGSFLLGTNNRFSTLSVVVAGNAAASTTTKLTENKTELIPVGEFEVGVAWGKPLAPGPVNALAAAETVPPTGPILWVKAGFVADVWGSLGFLSAPNNIGGFSDSALFLYGFSVMAGVDF